MILNKQHYKIVSFIRGFFYFFFSRLRLIFGSFKNNPDRLLSFDQLKSARLPILKRADDQATACISCDLCAQYCPTLALKVIGNRNLAPLSFDLHLHRCIECGLCIEICPVDALEYGEELHRVMDGLEPEWKSL